MSSAHFKAVESKEGVEDKFIDLTDLKLLYDLNGETALDYIGEEKARCLQPSPRTTSCG